MSRLHSHNDQEGFTLIELSLAVALFGVLSALVFKILTTFIDVSASTESRYSNTATAQDLTDVITRQIRLSTASPTDGPAFIAASPSSITFYVNQNDPLGPSTETISVATGKCPCAVTETVTPPQSQTATNYNTEGAVANRNLFEFYSQPSGTDLSLQQITIGASGASPAQLAKIAVVGITASIGTGTHSPVAEINQTVNLPNVAYVYQESQDS